MGVAGQHTTTDGFELAAKLAAPVLSVIGASWLWLRRSFQRRRMNDEALFLLVRTSRQQLLLMQVLPCVQGNGDACHPIADGRPHEQLAVLLDRLETVERRMATARGEKME